MQGINDLGHNVFVYGHFVQLATMATLAAEHYERVGLRPAKVEKYYRTAIEAWAGAYDATPEIYTETRAAIRVSMADVRERWDAVRLERTN